MKKTILLCAAALLVLSSCSGAAVETEAAAAMGTDENSQTASRLLMLTFSLEETDLAVTPQQAQDLLPLWKAVRAINSSDNASSLELEALYRQIQETMATEQLTLMEDGDFDNQAFAQIMQKYGTGIQRSRADSDSSSTTTRNQGARGGFGGGPGGGEFAGGGSPPDDFSSGAMPATGEINQGETASGVGGGGASMIQVLVDPLIELLKARAAE